MLPVQAKGGSDRIGRVQELEQDIEYCNRHFPNLITRAIAARVHGGRRDCDVRVDTGGDERFRIVEERHYKLVPASEITADDPQVMKRRARLGRPHRGSGGEEDAGRRVPVQPTVERCHANAREPHRHHRRRGERASGHEPGDLLNNSENNPANFFKDFVRVIKSANKNWPASVLAAGYTARQSPGAGECLRVRRAAARADGSLLGFPRRRWRRPSASRRRASRWRRGGWDEPMSGGSLRSWSR